MLSFIQPNADNANKFILKQKYTYNVTATVHNTSNLDASVYEGIA